MRICTSSGSTARTSKPRCPGRYSRPRSFHSARLCGIVNRSIAFSFALRPTRWYRGVAGARTEERVGRPREMRGRDERSAYATEEGEEGIACGEFADGVPPAKTMDETPPIPRAAGKQPRRPPRAAGRRREVLLLLLRDLASPRSRSAPHPGRQPQPQKARAARRRVWNGLDECW